MKKLSYFTKFEQMLWGMSVILTITAFIVFDRENYFALVATVIGITSLIFCAKGNPIGQILMIVFSMLYGFISYTFAYYGEMITYLGMTLPMAVVSLVSWLKNPYNKKRMEVKVNTISKKETAFMLVLSLVITLVFYYILKHFNTANLLPSTLSVTTSFVAAYLTFRRSPYFALCYALNDLVLIVLWILASIKDVTYISVFVCFVVFFVNDIYGFISWKKMQKRQKGNN